MCKGFNKCMLIAINVIFLIAGAGLTAVAIWVIVSQNTMFEFLQLLTKDVTVDESTMNNYTNSTSTLMAAAYVAVAFGAFSVIIGFCGCCGAIKENSCMLLFYVISITVILLAETAGAIAAGVFKSEIGNQLKPRLIALENNHFLPLNQTLANKTTNGVISAMINYAQVSLECCGVTNQSDITGNDTLWYRSTRMYNGKAQVMPVSCCIMKSNRGELLTKQDWNNIGNYLVDQNCPNTGNNSNTVGCYDKVDQLINTYSLPIIIVCAAVAAFEIFCVIMASCMVHKIRKGNGQHL